MQYLYHAFHQIICRFLKFCIFIYFRLQDSQVFLLIQRYGLYDEIETCIEDLMHLNVSESINLFLKHKERLSPSLVISRLKGNRYYQYLVRNFKFENRA